MIDYRRARLLAAATLVCAASCPQAVGASAPASPPTSPLLRCQVTYAGATHTLEAAVGGDPYTTQSVDIDGRFRFKAVLLGAGARIDMIKLYAYYETRRQPVLIEEVKYAPPYALSTPESIAHAPYALTGLHYLYAPPLGRELQYGCALLGAQS